MCSSSAMQAQARRPFGRMRRAEAARAKLGNFGLFGGRGKAKGVPPEDVKPALGKGAPKWREIHAYLRSYPVKTTTPEETSAMLERNRAVVLDVRFAPDFEAWRIPGSVSVPYIVGGPLGPLSGLSLWEVGIPVGVRGGLKERNKDFAPQAVDALGADAFGGRDVIVVCERGGSLVRDCIPAGSSISIEDTKAVSLQACYELAQCGVTGLRYIEGGLNEYYETQEVAGGILKGEGGPKNPDADWPGNWEWFGYRQFKFKDPRKGRREF